MDEVVLVDAEDNEVGLKDKAEVHLRDGYLHRAFTIFVFNRKCETLIARRSEEKMLWHGYWDSAGASHPKVGENYIDSAERRLQEELGLTCPLKLVDKFQYKADFENKGTEYEVCATLIGSYDGEIRPNPKEVLEWKWISVSALEKDIKKNGDKYVPWLKIALERLKKGGKI